MFCKWLDTFIGEKGIDLEQVLMVEGPSGENMIPIGCVVDALKQAPAHEQRGAQYVLTMIDWKNGNVVDYLGHLAQAIAQ